VTLFELARHQSMQHRSLLLHYTQVTISELECVLETAPGKIGRDDAVPPEAFGYLHIPAQAG
jgi:hypothetical protein